jgi:myo-inositol-1(or 4)-monophosphatase
MLEGASPARVALAAQRLDGRVRRLRAVGSLALSLCHAAAGRADAMVGLSWARPVDVAAAQLVAREAGLLVGLPAPAALGGTPLDPTTRFQVLAARDEEIVGLLSRALAPAARARWG